uniref:Uncharacterized protein n=1 Tax=Glossina palpalis gambiensis TaxID=67801 RepID=A0A1B0C7L5_9MUSC
MIKLLSKLLFPCSRNIHGTTDASTHTSNTRTLYFDERLSRNREVLACFIKFCPQTCLIQAKAQFASKGITRVALTQEIIATVVDFIRDPPPTNKYQELKRILINKNFFSEGSKTDKILSDTDIGDRKPPDFYQSFLVLDGCSFTRDLLKRL